VDAERAQVVGQVASGSQHMKLGHEAGKRSEPDAAGQDATVVRCLCNGSAPPAGQLCCQREPWGGPAATMCRLTAPVLHQPRRQMLGYVDRGMLEGRGSPGDVELMH